MLRSKSRTRAFSLLVLVLLVTALACSPLEGLVVDLGPSVEITSPTSGATAEIGEAVEIASTSTADAGIARVELLVDGDVVQESTPPSGNPSTFRLVQSWLPDAEGEVEISVVAYDSEGRASDEATVILNVGAGAAEAATPTPTPTEAPAACTVNAAFVTDVSIPADTEVAPGAPFIKGWRVQNSGTCDWGAGFTLVFASGDQMGGPASVPVPPTAAGDTVDLSVQLEAPMTYGTHSAEWRLRSDQGQIFGAVLSVQIIVPAPPTATPTVTPTPLPTDTPWPTPTWFMPIFTLGPIIITALPLFQPSVATVLEQVSIDPGDIGWETASCPSGSVVVSGGYAVHPDVLVYTHFKVGNGWRVYGQNNAGASKTLSVYAVCLSNTAGSVTQVSEQVAVAAGGVGHPIAACPAGSVVTGGGWASYADGSLHVYNSSKSSNGWQVYAKNNTGSTKYVKAYALCLSGTTGTTTQEGSGGSIAGSGTGYVVATCSGDGLAAGGGFAGGPDLRVYNTSPKPGSDNQWIVYARNSSGSSKGLNAYAVCLSFP
jgi:hypothetical protein